MKGRLIGILALCVMIATALPACEPVGPATLPPVKVAVGYVPNVQFTPLYVAIEMGFFTDEGIAVELEYGTESDLLKLVASGQLKVALASGDQVILARSQGLPVKYVMSWWHRYPVGVTSLDGAGIEGPSDLPGKTIGIPMLSGTSYVGWRALLYAAGIDPQSVSLQVIGYTQVASLSQHKVDGVLCYVNNEPGQLRRAGLEPVTIMVSDYIDLVANGFITSDKAIEEEPDLIQAIVSATLRGLEYTMSHPDESFEIALKFIPEMQEADKPLQQEVLNDSIQLWENPHLGATTQEAWEASTRFMAEAGLISQTPEIEDLYTNRFVDAAASAGQ